MKFFKAVLVVLLLLVSALVLVGVFVPEVDDEFETEINRPVIQVYAAMMNLQKAPEWVIGLDSVERTTGFLAMPGSTFKLYYSGSETNVVYNMEVIEMVPLKSVKFKLYNDMFEFDVTVNFEAQMLSTKMNTYVQMKGNGLLERSLLLLMKSSITQAGKDNFEALKELQEH
jgi:uncharacterized membrane protein